MFRLYRKNIPMPWLIIGLGNIGPQYARTRHNAGFEAVEEIARRLNVQITKGRCQSKTASATLCDSRLLIAQPQTYMNNSGQAVASLLRFYHVNDLSRLIILYDDIDLPLGAVRVRASGSAGTHNGMRSILEHLHGRQDFPRVRIGIGRPENGDLIPFVTGKYTPAQREIIVPAIQNAASAALAIVESGVESAMRGYNGGTKNGEAKNGEAKNGEAKNGEAKSGALPPNPRQRD